MTSIRWRRTGNQRMRTVFDQESTRAYQRSDLRVAEFAEQPPHVSIQRFFPGPRSLGKVAADQAGIDASIDGRRVQRHQPAFAIAGDADLGARRAMPLKPIDRGQHLLHFVADDVPAKLAGLPIDPLAMRLIGHRHLRIAGPVVSPVDERRHEHQHAMFGQPPGQL